MILSTNLAFGRTLPWSLLPAGTGRVLWIGLSLIFLGLCFTAEWRRSWIQAMDRFVARSDGRSARWALVLLVLGNLVLSVLNYRQFERFGYTMPYAQVIWCVIAAFTVRLDRLWVSCLFSLGMLVTAIFHFPLHIDRSDMLLVLGRGLAQWKEGISPYQPFVMESGVSNWLSYLPPVILSHLPAAVVGLDLRWNQVLYRGMWMAILAWTLRQRRHAGGDPPSSAWRLLMHLFILSPYFNYRHELYFEFYFVILALYGFVPKWRPLSLALMVLTRQWAWVLAPFEVLRAWMRRSGVRSLGFFLAWLIVLGGGLGWLLSLTTTLEVFLKSAFWFQDRLEWKIFPGDFGLTLAPLYYTTGMAKVAQVIQAGAVVFAVGLTGLKQRSLRTGSLATIALVVFVLFNHHFWAYFWLSPAFWIVCNELGPSRGTPETQV